MPVVDGIQARRAIKSMDGEKSTLPIIALTADISQTHIVEYEGVGFESICAKPLDLLVLLPTIDKCLG